MFVYNKVYLKIKHLSLGKWKLQEIDGISCISHRLIDVIYRGVDVTLTLWLPTLAMACPLITHKRLSQRDFQLIQHECRRTSPCQPVDRWTKCRAGRLSRWKGNLGTQLGCKGDTMIIKLEQRLEILVSIIKSDKKEPKLTNEQILSWKKIIRPPLFS